MSKTLFNHISRMVCACTKGRLALTLALALVALFATFGVLAKDSSFSASNAASAAKSLSSLPSRIKKRLFPQKPSQGKASLTTAKKGDLSGETVTFRGEGFRSGEPVTVQVIDSAGNSLREPLVTYADEAGRITASWLVSATESAAIPRLVTAQGQVSGLKAAVPQPANGTDGGCVSEVSGFKANCTANDVALTDIVPGSVIITNGGCTGSPTDTVTFTAQGVYQLTANARYDVGTFISTDGDPNGDLAKTGTCTRFSIESQPDPPYVSLDGDTCGDIDTAHSPLTQQAASPLGPVTIQCVDNDGDGKVDLIHCETWNQPGADITCTTSADIKAGSPAKCNCGTLPSFCIAVPDDNACTRDVCAGTCTGGPTPGAFCENTPACGTGGTCDNIHLQHIAQVGQACGDQTSGVCDNPNTCDANGVCQDNFKTATTTCRPSAGQCDVAESCTGTSAACPPDGFAAATTTCVGTSNGGACDGTDSCSGTANTCVDGFKSATTTCRASAGQCDVAESCSGTSGACPADGFAAATTTCVGTSNGGVCDGTDSCKGGENTCVDGFKSATTECRASAGQCDVAESCTGSSGACPADAFQPATTTCVGTSNGGVCDGTDSCKGGENTCVDGFKSATTVCRASAGQCDVAESCTGSSGACPANGFAPATTTCVGTSNGGACDGTDSCNGAGACVDGFRPATTICRPPATACDPAESCTGSSGACPTDVNPICEVDTQITPTATSCLDYTSGIAADLNELLYGLKGGKINSISPGVLFLYDTFHLDAACSTVTVNQTDGPWEPQFLGVHQAQVVLYSPSCGKLNVGTVSINAFGDVTITGVPPGDYVLGIKYDPTTLKGFSPGGNPSATFTFTVDTCGAGSGSDSIAVNPKP